MSTTRTGLLARAVIVLAAGTALAAGPVTAALGATPDPAATATTSPSASTSPSGPTPSDPAPSDSAPATSPVPSATPTVDPSASPPPSETASPSPTGTPSPSGAAQAVAPAALPGPGEPETQAAADFIARTLADGGHHYVYPGSTFLDGGNTIDAVLALAAAGTQQAEAQAGLAYLEAGIGSYVGTDFGDELYAGPTAKALIGILALGADPTDVGPAHLDLVTGLEGLRAPSGRFSDHSAYGDYSNTIGQSLAIIALARAGRPLTTSSVEFLLDQQCADGGFRGDLDVSGCTSDPDATAFAVQALLALPRALVCWTGVDAARSAAADGASAGLDRLASWQQGSGAVAGSDGTANANTTGVAGQAFVAGGRTAAAAQAAAFIATLQYGPSAPAALQGGIAYSDSQRSTSTPSDSDLRATPQATLALSGHSLLDAVAPEVVDPAPAEVCPPEPTVTPPSAPSSTTSAPVTTPAAAAGSGGGPTPGPVAAPAGGRLAQTGSDLLWPVLLGLGLVVTGAAAVVGSRRRGAHA